MKFSKQNLVLVAVVLGIFCLGAFVVKDKLVDAVASRVEERILQKYSPSPYGPGFDPDKIDSQKFGR